MGQQRPGGGSGGSSGGGPGMGRFDKREAGGNKGDSNPPQNPQAPGWGMYGQGGWNQYPNWAQYQQGKRPPYQFFHQ